MDASGENEEGRREGDPSGEGGGRKHAGLGVLGFIVPITQSNSLSDRIELIRFELFERDAVSAFAGHRGVVLIEQRGS